MHVKEVIDNDCFTRKSFSMSNIKFVTISIILHFFLACQQNKKPVKMPKSKDVLSWTQNERDIALMNMDKLFATSNVKSGKTKRLSSGKPLPDSIELEGVKITIGQFFKDQDLAGLIVMQNGEIRLEQYRVGFGKDNLWSCFSVTKLFSSTLLGVAIKDGYIQSTEDLIVEYIPELKGSAYDDVTVKHLLTMKSGVKWNEDYSDPESDVALYIHQKLEAEIHPVVLYMKKLEKDTLPGVRWHYNTGETDLIGVLINKATGKKLSEYLSEKIWLPYGMTKDAFWALNENGNEMAGSRLSCTTRDLALFGEFVLNDGKIDSIRVVPEGWFDEATTKHADINIPGSGYGYQWWTYDDGSFAAKGIFGQGIFIDPNRNLVIARHGNWSGPAPEGKWEQRDGFYKAIQKFIDSENKNSAK